VHAGASVGTKRKATTARAKAQADKKLAGIEILIPEILFLQKRQRVC
jgi:hypothetical protein